MNQETLLKVAQLVNEAQEIGFESIDKEKSKGTYQNMFGQHFPKIELKEGVGGVFFIKGDREDVPNPRIVEIGEELSKIGGLSLMQEAYYKIIKPFGGHGYNLKWAWQGVGDWRA